MGCEGGNCPVGGLIVDTRTGSRVCSMCGLVEENVYEEVRTTISDFKNPTNFKILEEIRDMLDRVHISTNLADLCTDYYMKNYSGFNRKAMVFSIYFVLNKYSFNVSLKNLLNANGLCGESTFSTQKSNENVILDIVEMVEKYSVMLGFNFKETSLIKEMVKMSPKSGHTPLTIIAGNIYLYCRKNNKKISTKQIAQTTQVSTISIQRYIKTKNGDATSQR